ncbi:unnamed protein product [Parnassius mnemosyne]|uniref:Ig-like domain-containing protein n=1 Tax=Parnassius mnemosyne TaxID=213953 RepID=A0AAV1L2D1_9NEOP
MLLAICYYGFLILCGCNINFVFGQLEDQKSSLTFVIDDTGSMYDDIEMVKSGASAIFNAVLNSKSSQIGNFILVTFNDPDIKPATITTNEDNFRNALNLINVDGGADCPEMAMKGIEEAITASLPGSYIYVFTDASAKDYITFPRVKSIAHKKQCQIVFVLTGMCEGNSDPAYRVYHELADATSGQVFHLEKNEVRKILDYVAETVKSRKTELASKKFPPGYGKTFSYTVDDKTKDVIIAISGVEPKVDVTKPDGSEAKTKDIVKTEKIAVVKVPDAEPGIHAVKVGSKSETKAVVTGETTLNFQHGFSAFKPTTIKDTVTRPISDKKSYLAIELSNKDNDVRLKSVEFLDMDGNIIFNQPLYDVDRDFYVTEQTMPPNSMFKIAVNGYNTNTNAPIRRVSSTPIEPQKLLLDETVNRAATVTIEGEYTRKIKYGNKLQLKCKVNGYPQPIVTWIDENTGVTLPSVYAAVDLPYDYISVLDLEKITKTTSYQCRAVNDYGEDKKSVTVEAVTKFNILNVSEDTSIDYEFEGKLYCIIDADPPSHVIWYFNGDEIKDNDDVEKSSDGSVLTISTMQPKYEGKYTCEVKNEFNKKVFFINLSMSGTALPKIDKTATIVHVKRGQNVDIMCSVIDGIPQPWIRWSFKRQFEKKFTEVSEESDIYHIERTDIRHAGTYKCEASNIIGKDSHEINLIVEYPPTIKDGRKFVEAREGERILILCEVDGVPKPEVKWDFDGAVIKKSLHRQIYRDNSLSFEASMSTTGSYTCEATNKLGTASKTTKVVTYVPVSIEAPIQSKLELIIGNSLTLPCQASGYPKPKIEWIFFNKHKDEKKLSSSDASGALHLSGVQVDQSGFYFCFARNTGGSANIAYEVEILAPPSITNLVSSKAFAVVVGDLVLRIPCNATGNPKPTITWVKNGLNIAAGTEWHDIEEDGTLVIKNIDDTNEGLYICIAQNSIGTDSDIFKINVLQYPKPTSVTSSEYVEVGKSARIDCDIPHKLTDILSWYKDSRIIASSELVLNNIKISDDGLYTCHVSTFAGSTSATKRVIVGYKPSFITEEDEHMDFSEGREAYLSCAATGEPTPKVTWWHNGKELDKTEQILHILSMSLGDLGRYSCDVSNHFGTITRNFEISASGCLLNMQTSTSDVPDILSIDLRNSAFDNIVYIPKGETIPLYCRKGFVNFPYVIVDAICVSDSTLKIKDDIISFSEIKCK